MEEQDMGMSSMPEETKKKKDLGDHAIKAGGDVAKASGKVATGVLKELLIFFRDLTFKAKLIFLIISVFLVLIAYFFGYQSGKANADQDLKDQAEEAQEKLEEVRETLN